VAEVTRAYSNGEITVLWRRALCTHAGLCFRVLPQVFNPRLRPWVNVAAADTERIAAQVARCPSGALSCFRNDGTAAGGALCRCGRSSNKPYCDGTHAKIGFEDE
jgi:uncharacterized Fe-S cluster protein YjdI